MTQNKPQIDIDGCIFDLSVLEDSPEIINFKNACKQALTNYKKEFVTIDLRQQGCKYTLTFLFLYINDDFRINVTERNEFRCLYTEIYPQLSKGIVEFDINSLRLINKLFEYVLTNPKVDNDMISSFQDLKKIIGKHIDQKTKEIIIRANHPLAENIEKINEFIDKVQCTLKTLNAEIKTCQDDDLKQNNLEIILIYNRILAKLQAQQLRLLQS